uniref:Phospholipid scramblase n=2 Tax=Oryza nivara TaxID=4536 RepID=A0A0E0G439_ORYNI
MRWLLRLLSHAAAAGRATAKTTGSHVGGSNGFASGRGGDDGTVVPREWLQKLWTEELRKQRDVARRWGWRAVATSDGGGADSFGDFAMAPSRSFQHDDRDLTPNSWIGLKGIGYRMKMETNFLNEQDGHFCGQAKLKPLLSRANLLIARDIEWANIMLAFEQPVGFIREKSNVIFRQLFRSRRPFVAEITDAMGNEIFTVRRPFWLINSSIYAEVNGKEVGVVHRRWHLWRRIYDLYLGNRQFAVVENPGFWNWTFTLTDEDDNVLAQIDRNWRGIGFELFTDAGQYAIRFGDAGLNRKFGLASDVSAVLILVLHSPHTACLLNCYLPDRDPCHK